ncbi:MAG: sulfatase-like hydrolase/transferase [Candidatus Omnitrophota bacterium]
MSNGSVNAPFRGQKTTLLEGGIRVPFIFKFPGILPAGKTVDEIVSALDIFPTFVELAGGTITREDDLDGINILPFLTGQTEEIPREPLKFRYTCSVAMIDGNWKLIRLPDRLPMLYNLSNDISEQNDLALQELDRTKAMLKKLGTWDNSLMHPVFEEPVSWRMRHLRFYDEEYQLTQPD